MIILDSYKFHQKGKFFVSDEDYEKLKSDSWKFSLPHLPTYLYPLRAFECTSGTFSVNSWYIFLLKKPHMLLSFLPFTVKKKFQNLDGKLISWSLFRHQFLRLSGTPYGIWEKNSLRKIFMILEGFSLIFHRKQISTYKLILVDPVKHEKKRVVRVTPKKARGRGVLKLGL